MEKTILEKFSQKLKISVDQIAREYWEMTLLNEISNSTLGKKLIFKGGTSLRLAYGSPRFSGDLDFSLKEKVLQREFFRAMKSIKKKFYGLEITDLKTKYYTSLCEFKIKEEVLKLPFRVKIEISRRKFAFKFKLRLLTTPVSPVSTLCFVADLNAILKEKIKALNERKEPRDIFDIWFICQKLEKEIPQNLPKIPNEIMRRELRKYLPTNFWSVIENL